MTGHPVVEQIRELRRLRRKRFTIMLTNVAMVVAIVMWWLAIASSEGWNIPPYAWVPLQ
jgi:hypothetical protein